MPGVALFLMMALGSASWSLDYASIVTDEWTYANINSQNIFGAIGWLSMFIGFGTTYHFYQLIEAEKAKVLQDRLDEIRGPKDPSNEEGEPDQTDQLIAKMKVLLAKISDEEESFSEEEDE